jgi:hypothetical protein
VFGGLWKRGARVGVVVGGWLLGAVSRELWRGQGLLGSGVFGDGLGFPSNREGFRQAAAGWSAASLSYWVGDINAAELCRRRVL